MRKADAKLSQKIRSFIENKGWLGTVRSVKYLAAGEYNENYHVRGARESFVFRVNHGSQLGLPNQIEYEFGVLKLLEQTGVTPRAFFYESRWRSEGGGVMLEEYIPGRPLNYKRDTKRAAAVFAKIHSVHNRGNLIVQNNPFRDLAEESRRLLGKYQSDEFPEAHRLLSKRCEDFLKSPDLADVFEGEELCVVNTEVNSGNFVLGRRESHLVDWEKAVFSFRYQDLAHFLAATTTLWKTDYRYSEEGKIEFFKDYSSNFSPAMKIEELREKTGVMERAVLLRALSWCYMAHYEYVHLPRVFKNEATFRRIKSYLSEVECFLK